MLLLSLKTFLEANNYTNVFVGNLPKQSGDLNKNAIVLRTRSYIQSNDIEARESVGIRVYRNTTQTALDTAFAIQTLLAKSNSRGIPNLATNWYYATITNNASIDEINPNGNPEAYLTVDFNTIESYLNK